MERDRVYEKGVCSRKEIEQDNEEHFDYTCHERDEAVRLVGEKMTDDLANDETVAVVVERHRLKQSHNDRCDSDEAEGDTASRFSQR